MFNLSFFDSFNNYIFGFFIRPPPVMMIFLLQDNPIIKGGPIMDKYFNTYREMLSLRGLTDHTIKSYSTYIRAYLDYLSKFLCKQPESVSWQELRDFVKWLQLDRALSDRTMNAVISQLRFFSIYVLHQPWIDSQLPKRKFDEYLPFVSSKKETWTFISTIPDIRIKTFVTIMYSAGLRVGEVRHLKCSDIEHSNNRIFIRQCKNRSSRYAILSVTAWNAILEYYYSFPADQRPSDWLFTQRRDKSRPIDHQVIPTRLMEHEKRLGWEHRISCHTFRHAFGTHLYENGTDLLTINALLGHKSLNSTTIYVSLASNGTTQTVSPLDTMAGEYHG